LRGKGEIIESWVKTKSELEQSGHIWIKNKTMKSKLKGLSVWSKPFYERLPFFSTLSSLAQSLQKGPSNEEDIKKFQSLMQQGLKEVPLLAFRFNQGLEIVNNPKRIQNEILSYSDSLHKPFLRLFLAPNQTLKYHNNAKTKVSKILFLFGGWRQESTFNVKFFNQFSDPTSYNGIIDIEQNTKGNDSIHYLHKASFQLDQYGQLVDIKPINPPMLNATLKNFGDLLYRMKFNNLDSMVGRKVIHLDKNGKVGAQEVPMNMAITIDGLEVTPKKDVCLKISMKLSQVESGGTFRFHGNGSGLIRHDGVFVELDNNVQLKVRMLGLPLVKGYNKNEIKLVY
jgi:hypothetical protein